MTETTPVHLVLLIHGLYGTPSNLAVVQGEVHKAASALALPDTTSSEGNRSSNSLQTVTYVTTSFVGSRTWDGIDVNASRAAEELDTEIERLKGEGKAVVGLSVVSL